MNIFRCVATALAVAAAVAAGACGSGNRPASNETTSAPASTPPASPASTSAEPEPATLAEIFPAGAGKETVLNSCGSCHNLACSAIGQRTASRWDALKMAHKDRIPDADRELAFTYLSAHFNDSTSEPRVPSKFLAGGCTPF